MDDRNDLISRQAAIDGLWKALYEYQDKTEKQFQDSEELDLYDWMVHRIFVQNMSDIDMQTILNLPSAQPEIVRCKDCKHRDPEDKKCDCGMQWCVFPKRDDDFCSYAERKTDE